MKKNIPTGQILLNKGLISEKQLERALEIQKKTPGRRIGDILIDLSYVTEENMLKSLSERVNAPYIDISQYPIDRKAANLVKPGFAKKYPAIPIDIKNNMLIVATNDPLGFYMIDEIKAITGYDASIVLATKKNIEDAIEKLYSEEVVNSAVENINKEFNEGIIDNEMAMMGERVEGTPIVKLVNTIISQAYTKGASDVHIEPFEKSLIIRIRINGELIHHTTMNIAAHNPIVTRLKILAGINIAEKRVPQDGKFKYSSPDLSVDVRVSSLPTIYGEKVVLRLLGQKNTDFLLDLKQIGLSDNQYEIFERMLSYPNGIILVTGPTGSGKTTTLYAALNKIVQKNINIVTVEDPVEKPIANTTQVQVNIKAGLTFVSALRSILRQDPDVIMIGEMRDGETATIGIRAAITGHLVLSTMHTNDAISSVTRLIDMGVPAYMTAASISGLVAQRLIKVLCPHCKAKYQLTDKEKLLFDKKDVDIVYESVGCERCNYTGYRGRMAIYEIIEVNANLRKMIVDGVSNQEIHKYEAKRGTKFLKDSILELVVNGETSLSEMKKIIYSVE